MSFIDNLYNELKYDALKKLFNSDSAMDRRSAALAKYKLDVLINDPDPLVRSAVALVGYGLDTLYKDPDENVRKAVASKGYKLPILLLDESLVVKRQACITLEQKIRENKALVFIDKTL